MRRLILIAAAGLMTQLSFSQAEFGLKGGIGLNNIKSKGGQFKTFENVTLACTFGATLDIIASDAFTVQPELNFISLKANDNINNIDYKYSYITLPVLLKYKFAKSPVSVYVGPQLGFLTSASSRQNDVKSNRRTDFSNTDFAAVFGIDFRLPQGLRFDLRYNRSMIDLLKVEASSPFEARSQIVTFTVGHVFGKKK